MRIDPAKHLPETPAGSREARPAPASAPKTPAAQPPNSHSAPAVPQRSVSVRMDQSQRIYYELIDDSTGEVILQVPPEEVLRVARSITELLEAEREREHRTVDVKS